MLAERYLRRRYYEGKEEGREEGLEEGREEGRVEGREEGLREGSVKFAERLKNLSDKERQEEIDRLISETRDTNGSRRRSSRSDD